MRRCAAVIIVLLSLCLSGCGNLSDTLGPEGTFRSLHAVPDLWQGLFYVRDRFQGTLEYSGATGLLRVGEDLYPFRLEVRVPGASNRIALSFDQQIDAGQQYTFVFTGNEASPAVTVWQWAEQQFSGSASGAAFGHADQTLGSVDVYLEAPGTNLATATPRATLGFGQHAEDLTLTAGQYELTITSSGNPAGILFQSASFDLPAGVFPTFAILAGAGQYASAVIVRVLDLSGITLLEDISTQPTLRGMHAVSGQGNIDIAVDSQFTPPLIGNLAFKGISAAMPTTADSASLKVTAAGDPATVLVDTTMDLVSGSLNAVTIVGPSGSEEAFTVTETGRPLAAFALFHLVQGASNASTVDVYLVPAGQDFTQSFPLVQDLALKTTTGYPVINPGSYDLVITPANSTTVLVRADGLTLDALKIYSALLVDTADPAIMELVGFDDLVLP